MVREDQDSGAIASAAGFHITQNSEIGDARFHVPWQGVSTEQLARVLAQVGANRRAALAQTALQSEPDPADPARLQVLLWAQIDELYAETVRRASRSPILSDFCLNLLRQARIISLSRSAAGSLVTAEQYLEQVRVKLSRADGPLARAEANQVIGIVVWTLAAVVICLPLAALPWLYPYGLVGRLQIPQEYIVLFGALGWGALGGAASTFHHLPWFVQLREYDPAYYVDYLARPVKGLMIGGLMFLLLYVGAGAFSGIIVSDGTGLHSTFVFLGATAAGYKQEHIMQLVDTVLRTALRRSA